VELFATLMTFAWYNPPSRNIFFLIHPPRCSSENCARIYNQAIGISGPNTSSFIQKQEKQSTEVSWWQLNLKMTPELVKNSFIIHSLLKEHAERNLVLELRHKGDHHYDILKEAMHI
jgi:hypothetical protein